MVEVIVAQAVSHSHFLLVLLTLLYRQISMIQNAMKQIHYSVNTTKNAKSQVLYQFIDSVT